VGLPLTRPVIPYIFFNHGKNILSNCYFLLSWLWQRKYLRVGVAQWVGEPICIHTRCADDGGGLGPVVLLGCGLEDAGQISHTPPFCAWSTTDFWMSSLQNLVGPRTSQGKRLVPGRNSHLLGNCWSLDWLYHQKTDFWHHTWPSFSCPCNLPRKFLMGWITSLIHASAAVQEITHYMQKGRRGAHIIHTYELLSTIIFYIY